MTSRCKNKSRRGEKLLLPPIDQQFGRNGTERPRRRGELPRDKRHLFGTSANRAMFQNKPATHASSEWCEFPSGVRSAFRRRATHRPIVVPRPRRRNRQEPKSGRGKVDRAGPGIYVYVQNRSAKGGDAECGAEGGALGPPRLVLPSRLRLSVINLIEALSLLDCGSKRREGERETARLKEG